MKYGLIVRRANMLRCVLLAGLVSVVVLGGASVAFALNTAVWTAASPGAGATVQVKPTALSVMADDSAPILSATVTLNGTRASYVGVDHTVGFTEYNDEAEEYYWVVTDYSVARVIGYFPSSRVLTGTNTVVTTVTSSLGVSTYTRTFSYGSAPTISSVSPAAEAVLSASPAALTASWTSGSTPLSSTMTLDGAVVPTTYSVGTKTFTYAVAQSLTAGWHAVTFTARDAQGGTVSTSWRFKVQPPMSTGGECATCHSTFPSAHPVDVCAGCHARAYTTTGHGSSVPTAAGCTGGGTAEQSDACHRLDHTSDPQWGVWGSGPFACTDCHSATYPAVAQHTDAGTTTVHVSSVGCSPCHSNSLITEHGKYPIAATIKYQCDLCHAPNAPGTVKSAIAANDTRCSTCHSTADHQARHDAVFTPACAGGGCHVGSNISDFHAVAGTPCAGCHESSNPNVVEAIAGKNTDCAACHTTQGVDYHLQAATKHASPTTITCFGVGCHDASRSLPTVHAIYAGPGTVNPGYADACRLCHSNPAINTKTSGPRCTPTCHSGTTHAGYAAGHTTTAASAACKTCHTSDLSGIHGAMTDFARCAWCHSDPANGTKTADCASCHAGIDHEPAHVTPVTADCAGSECHAGTSLTSLHINARTALTCYSCHDSVDAKVVAAIAGHDKACTACHDAASPHGDEAVVHASTIGDAIMLMGAGPEDGDHGSDWATWVNCTWCHEQNLVTQHGSRCSLCHAGANTAGSLGTWNKTCQQGACHPAFHTTLAPNHGGAYYNSSTSCDSCHTGVPDWPGEVDCFRCH